MNTTNKFMFFENFLLAIEKLPEDKRAKACYEFCKYGITGVLPDDENLAMFCIGVSASIQKYQGRGGFREGSGRKSKESEKSKESKESYTTNRNRNRNRKRNIKEVELNRYGELGNVCLTEQDYQMLFKENTLFLDAVEKLDGWLDTKGGEKNKNRNHRCYFKKNSWVWENLRPTVKKEDDSFLEEMVKQQNERLGL